MNSAQSRNGVSGMRRNYVYVMASVAGGLALARHSGLLPLNIVPIELLDGFALGACISVVVSRLAGGRPADRRPYTAPAVQSARAELLDPIELRPFSYPRAEPVAHTLNGPSTRDAASWR